MDGWYQSCTQRLRLRLPLVDFWKLGERRDFRNVDEDSVLIFRLIGAVLVPEEGSGAGTRGRKVHEEGGGRWSLVIKVPIKV